MSEAMRYIGSKDGKTQYQKELKDYQDLRMNDICDSFFQVIDHKLKQDRKKMEDNIGRPLATQDFFSTGNEGVGDAASTGTDESEEKPNDPSKIKPLFPVEVTEE